MTLRFELIAKSGGAAILPDNRVVDGLAGCTVPNDGRFALIGDADGTYVARLGVGLGQSLQGNGDL